MTKRQIGIWFTAVLAISLISRWRAYQYRADRCKLDGIQIAPIYRVDLMSKGSVLSSFCCISCAREWPDVPPGAYWRVRDEITGLPLDAENACFVQSQVVTVPARQDRYHVFKKWNDALEHCDQFHGTRIANPLVLRSTEAQGREFK